MPGFSSCKQTEKERDCDCSQFSWTIHCLGPIDVIDTVTENKQTNINSNQIKHHPKVSSQSKDHRTVTATSTLPLTLLNTGRAGQGVGTSRARRPRAQAPDRSARTSRQGSAALPKRRVNRATFTSIPDATGWPHRTHPGRMTGLHSGGDQYHLVFGGNV